LSVKACRQQEAKSLEQLFNLAQIIGSAGVVLSLIFVGVQVRQNTRAIQRNEHNATMAQWTAIRMAIARNRDIAEYMTDGLQGARAMDAADQLRMEMMLQENMWAAFHIWDREQRGVFPKGTFAQTGGAPVCPLLATPRGGAWWGANKNIGFLPQYAAVVDTLLAKLAQSAGAADQKIAARPILESMPDSPAA
jgi:hypothetical protein